jgi:hypothetical protein
MKLLIMQFSPTSYHQVIEAEDYCLCVLENSSVLPQRVLVTVRYIGRSISAA